MRRFFAGLPLLLLGAAAPEVGNLFHRGLAPVDLGATPPVDHSAAACVSCHAGEHEEWAASRHAVAWTNGIFQREFLRQPLDWCVRCHAPLAAGGAESVDTVAAEGVNCAVCHLRDGRMLAEVKSATSPHDTVAVAGFARESFCGGCHQFPFPVVEEDGSVVRYTEHPMQNTIVEFRAGPFADSPRACLGCHGNTPAGHRFPGAHDLGTVQHAAELRICRSGASLRVDVRNVGAGHALPTGDLHRHLQLRAWRSSAPTLLWEAFIGRAFEPAEGGGKRVRVDTSIPPQETRSWTVDPRALGGSAAEPVAVELRYVFTADEVPTERNDPGEPTSAVVHAQRVTVKEVDVCR